MHRSDRRGSFNQGNSTGNYDLSAILIDGSKVKLIRGLKELSDARYLERQLKSAMNIAPMPVDGECVE